MKKMLLTALMALGMTLAPMASLTVAAACPPGTDPITCGVQETCPNGVCPKTSVSDLVDDIINIFSWIVGVVSVIMIIFGGFKYITSGGDAGKVTSAKNTILYAIVGLVIAALAQVIVLFVLGNATA